MTFATAFGVKCHRGGFSVFSSFAGDDNVAVGMPHGSWIQFQIASHKMNVNLIMVQLLWLCVLIFLQGSIAQETGECAADDETCSSNEPFHVKPTQFYINGKWVDPLSSSTEIFAVIDPSTAEQVTNISLATQEDVDAAVAAAKAAQQKWRSTELKERRQLVEKLLDIYNDRAEEMAQLISTEMGAPIDLARDGQVGSGEYHIEVFLNALQYFEFERRVHGYDEEDDATTTILMEPIGVVALITPWNWPMNQVTLKVIPALLVGCTCILKPSEQAPLSSMLFAEMIHEAGFPPGVFNLINGDGAGAGTLLSSHKDVRMTSFTGSARAGALVSKAAADTFKRVSLELGGKGANIIFADAKDWEDEIEDGVWRAFDNSGQSCNAPTRMLVERSIYKQAVEIARKTAESAEVGSAHEEGDHLGPVVSKAQFDKIQGLIETGIEEGAELVAGGLGRPEGVNQQGFYVRPTVFANVTNDMTIMQTEIFGPVLSIMPFDTEEEAIEIANDSQYGLTNYVQTRYKKRRKRMARALQSGMIEMNGIGFDYGAPFGGIKASGNAREGGVYGLEEFCILKVVSGYPRVKVTR